MEILLTRGGGGRVNIRSRDGRDKKLRSVGVLAGVGHAEQTLAGVTDLEVLILELVTVDRLATGAWILSVYPSGKFGV